MHPFFPFLVAMFVGQSEAEKPSSRQRIFRIITKNGGPSLHPHDIISNHTADSPTECSLRCLQKSTCAGFNYRSKSNKFLVNCEVSNKSDEKNIEREDTGEWTFYQNLLTVMTKHKREQIGRVNTLPNEPQISSTKEINLGQSCKDILAANMSENSGSYWIKLTSTDPLQVYCDMETYGGGWTLVYSYTFTNYSSFGSDINAVTPRPTWYANYATVPTSTTPPLNESTLGAVVWKHWKDIGEEFMVKSNINDWIVCQPAQNGSIVERKEGGLSCQNIKNVTTACVKAPNRIKWWGNGPTIYDEKAYYFFDGSETRGFPTHDPCGEDNPSNQKKGVNSPGGQIYLR